MPAISHTWGTTLEERQLVFPCDPLIVNPDDILFRGISVNATPAILFRWLCQLRVAPYSYDLIDNGGQQSPPQLIPGLDHLELGQSIMTIFDLVDFAQNEHLTIRIRESKAMKVFGDIAVSYLVVSKEGKSSRLLVKMLVKYPKSLRGAAAKRVLPWGDLIMMRRQLLNLKSLAESSVSHNSP
jgi:hypothetical protein